MRFLVWPMALTCLRIVLVPFFLVLLGMGLILEAFLLFVFMGVTDFLDGYLARRLNQTSRIGELLDPVADKLLIVSTLLLLSFPRFDGDVVIPLSVLACIMGKDALTIAGSIVLLWRVRTARIVAQPIGKITTFLQICLVLVTLLARELATRGISLDMSLNALWYTVSVFSVASGVTYLRGGIRQYYLHRRMLRSGGISRIAINRSTQRIPV